MDQLPSEVTIESTIHTDADNVLSSLSSGSDGIFQRDSIMAEEGEADEGQRQRVVLWIFKLEKAKKIVEWLLRMKIEKDGGDGYTIKLKSVEDEGELPEDALDKLRGLRARWIGDAGVVGGFMKDCKLILRNMKYGRSIFFFSGEVVELADEKPGHVSSDIIKNVSSKVSFP